VNLFSHAGTTCGNTTVTFPLGFGAATLVGLQCPTTASSPIKPGMSIVLPDAAPPGNYVVKVDAKDGSSNEVYCMQASFAL